MPRGNPLSSAIGRSEESSESRQRLDSDAQARERGTRIELSVGGMNLSHSNNVSRSITKIFRRAMYPEGFTWSKISHDHKMLWFNELKKEYWWKSNIENDVMRLFMGKAQYRYKDMCSRLKLRKERPPHIDASEWVKWQKYWESEDFKSAPEKGSKNRKAGTIEGRRHPPHTGLARERSMSVPA